MNSSQSIKRKPSFNDKNFNSQFPNPEKVLRECFSVCHCVHLKKVGKVVKQESKEKPLQLRKTFCISEEYKENIDKRGKVKIDFRNRRTVVKCY